MTPLCMWTSQAYKGVQVTEGASKYLGLPPQKHKPVFVYLVLGNLPDHPKKDNEFKFPVSGFTGA